MDLGGSPSYQVNPSLLRDIGVDICLCQEGIQMLVWIYCPIVLLEVEWFSPQGYVYLHNVVDKRMPTDGLPNWMVYVGET